MRNLICHGEGEWAGRGRKAGDALFPEEPVVPLCKLAKVTSGDPGSRGKAIRTEFLSQQLALENRSLQG